MLGEAMRREIDEQPAALGRLVDRFEGLRADVTRLGAGVAGVAFLARGSSDRAALLGRYAVEVTTGLPTCQLAPSLVTDPPVQRFGNWLVIALSQSGQTPEIVSTAAYFKSAGARLLAITNDPDSALAQHCDVHVDLGAGPEVAVPATKTVTAQMLTTLAVSTALTDSPARSSFAPLAEVPDAVATVLADEEPVRDIASELAAYDRLAVVGRKWCYPAALETALKLQETVGVMAHGFSTADFRHGPIAVCGPTTPAVVLAGAGGAADDDSRALVDELRQRRAWPVQMGVGTALGWPALGHAGECVLATVRGQQLAYHWSMVAGVDPDRPIGLRKVTLTH